MAILRLPLSKIILGLVIFYVISWSCVQPRNLNAAFVHGFSNRINLYCCTKLWFRVALTHQILTWNEMRAQLHIIIGEFSGQNRTCGAIHEMKRVCSCCTLFQGVSFNCRVIWVWHPDRLSSKAVGVRSEPLPLSSLWLSYGSQDKISSGRRSLQYYG